MQIQTDIQIDAPLQAVWAVFTDFDRYPSWNPFVKSLSGKVAVGNNIKVQLPGMNFAPSVEVFTEQEEFTWQGHLWGIKGLFDGRHSFRLRDNGDGTTTFLHGETFKGILVPLFKGMLQKQTRPGFEEMNRALKEAVERG